MFGEAIGQAVSALLSIDVATLIGAGIALWGVKYIYGHLTDKK